MKKLVLVLGLLMAAPKLHAVSAYSSGGGGPSATDALTVSSLTVTNGSTLSGNVTVGSGGGSKTLTLGSGSGSDSPQVILNAGSSGNAIVQEKVNSISQLQLYTGGSDTNLRGDTNLPMYFWINGSQVAVQDLSGWSPPQAASIRGTLTPRREGQQIWDTVAHEMCVSTGTANNSWVLVMATTTACKH